MSDKVLIIIATSDHGKAQTGVTYAMRTMQEGWMGEVKLIFFGPGQNVLLENKAIQDMVKVIGEAEKPLVCKRIADSVDQAKDYEALGVDVVYVGKVISDLIKEGYVPMVW